MGELVAPGFGGYFFPFPIGVSVRVYLKLDGLWGGRCGPVLQVRFGAGLVARSLFIIAGGGENAFAPCVGVDRCRQRGGVPQRACLVIGWRGGWQEWWWRC